MGVIHWSTTTLQPLRAHVSNTDHLITMQCSAGKPWVLAFMWMPLDMHHTSQNRCTPSTTPHGNDTPLMAAAPQQDNAPTHYKNCSGMAWGAQQKARGVDLANKFTRSQSNWASVGRGETLDPWKQDPMDPVQTARCQTPQDTPRGLMTMPRQVRAVLAA